MDAAVNAFILACYAIAWIAVMIGAVGIVNVVSFVRDKMARRPRVVEQWTPPRYGQMG